MRITLKAVDRLACTTGDIYLNEFVEEVYGDQAGQVSNDEQQYSVVSRFYSVVVRQNGEVLENIREITSLSEARETFAGMCEKYGKQLNHGRAAIALARFNLGRMYAEGSDLEKDSLQALFWYQQAARQGHAQAQFDLGVIYAAGDGVEKDARTAAFWYRLAAEQGHAAACLSLGILYARGEGVKQDSTLAVHWYRRAAERGYAEAQFYLGVMYANGDGVERDAEMAAFWYGEAGRQGHAPALFFLATGAGKETNI
jgi:TPR repeat protein